KARAVPAAFAGAAGFLAKPAVFLRQTREAEGRKVLVEAVEAGWSNPARVAEYPAEVRPRALALLLERQPTRDPARLAQVADLLAKEATGPDRAADLYRAAEGYARATGFAIGEARSAYATEAVRLLREAAAAGYRGPVRDRPAWKPVREAAGAAFESAADAAVPGK